jgi:hypothetical protein
MSNDKSGWERLLEQISSPWDWAAAAAGAAGGAIITVSSGGADFGTSVTAGAATGLAARKALAASLQRRWLRNRALGLKKELNRYIDRSEKDSEGYRKVTLLVNELERELSLWESHATASEDLAKQLDLIIQRYRDNLLLIPFTETKLLS